ncbi:MAG: serpin family protein [Actinomycetota bacterium]
MRRTVIIAILCLSLVAAACGDDGELPSASTEPTTTTTTSAPSTGDTTPPTAIGSEAERAPVDASAAVDVLAAGINDAGFDLLRTLPGDENAVLGPASIAHALLMAQAAADPATRDAIDAVFGFQPDAHEAWNALDQAIEASQSDRLIVSIADRIWPRLDVEPDPAWIDLLASRHGADVVPLDFADAEPSREIINGWVAEQTRDRIPELLKPGIIGGNTVLVLTNAMYFEADWRSPFGKYGTIETDFTRLDGSTVPVELMVELELGDRRGAGDGFVGAEIPYAGDEYSMLVIVPDEGRFAEIAERLDQSLLDEIDQTFTPGPFELHLPQWATTTDLDLFEFLSEAGAAPGAYPAISPGAFLGAAVHAADIEVTDTGTIAAAATALEFAESGPPEPELLVAADQPFLYLIRHRESGLVLFSGQLVDPTA